MPHTTPSTHKQSHKTNEQTNTQKRTNKKKKKKKKKNYEATSFMSHNTMITVLDRIPQAQQDNRKTASKPSV